MARLAIAKGFLAEYAKLDKDVQGAVDVAIARFARHAQPGSPWRSPAEPPVVSSPTQLSPSWLCPKGAF